MTWQTLSHALLFLISLPLLMRNRIRSTPWLGPGIISTPVQSCYRVSPSHSSAHQRRASQVCQRLWDGSFPPDPLSRVRPRYELDRRLHLGKQAPTPGPAPTGALCTASWRRKLATVSQHTSRHYQKIRASHSVILSSIRTTLSRLPKNASN